MASKNGRRQAPEGHHLQPCWHRRLVTSRPSDGDRESPDLVCREWGAVLSSDAPLEDPAGP